MHKNVVKTGHAFPVICSLTDTRRQTDMVIITISDALAYRLVFTARCYASAVLEMALCPPVRLSVRHKSEFY